MNPSITAEKILSTFSDSSSCCLQKCHLDSIEVTPECVFNLCQSQVRYRYSDHNVNELLEFITLIVVLSFDAWYYYVVSR